MDSRPVRRPSIPPTPLPLSLSVSLFSPPPDPNENYRRGNFGAVEFFVEKRKSRGEMVHRLTAIGGFLRYVGCCGREEGRRRKEGGGGRKEGRFVERRVRRGGGGGEEIRLN